MKVAVLFLNKLFLYSVCVCARARVQNTYTNDPLVSALGLDDGSIEADQRRQSLRHPVGHHRHGAEHRADLQHGDTHAERARKHKLWLPLTRRPSRGLMSC